MSWVVDLINVEPNHRSPELKYFVRGRADPWVTFHAAVPFAVDGIEYFGPPLGFCTRSMIDLFVAGGGDPARMRHDKPPTEDEIDHWVRYDCWP